jgi:pyruvate/2-oxoglutarate dehydrogenase complex dihydrolipoamide acyltransferase (E2) component
VDGVVARIECGVQDRVHTNTAVVTIDSDGMPVAVQAGVTGVVAEMRAVLGATVEPGQVLAVVTDVVGGAVDDLGDVEPGEDPDPEVTCSRCGAQSLELGYVEDTGQHSEGRGLWVEGPFEMGFFGPRRSGRRRRAIEAYRCPQCMHLELFAIDEM